jgi:acetoin utilization deacetylase AcuC-like enzyme
MNSEGCRKSFLRATITKLRMRVFYSREFAVESDLETVSKSRIIAQLLRERLPERVELVAPKPVTREELLKIHGVEYVDSVLSGRIGRLAAGDWSAELLQSILFSTGGMRDAVASAIESGASACLASGQHHARRDRGFVLCTFNGIALAALTALERVKTVGILDLDAHFGGGTFSILGSHPGVHFADVSVWDLDRWTPTDAGRHYGCEAASAAAYLPAVRRALKRMEGVDFLIYYAGMDPHEGAGGIDGISGRTLLSRDRLVARWCAKKGVPVLIAPAGGYSEPLSLEEIAELHFETIRTFVGVF